MVATRVSELLGLGVRSTSPVFGGDICEAYRMSLADGRMVFVKTLAEAPPGFFAAETRGLRWLGAAGAGSVPVPDVLAAGDDILVLPWVEPGPATADAAEEFGRALAATHLSGATKFGAEEDGFVGSLPMPNQPAPTWPEFYAEQRLRLYLRLGRDRGRIGSDQIAAVERVAARLPDLVPAEPPARLHGDLWFGNVLWARERPAHVVDPAAYGGHREVDLAMLQLFGLPHLERVLAAYDEAAPLADGWRERVGLHQLFPLLVHTVLFGGGYGARAAEIASGY